MRIKSLKKQFGVTAAEIKEAIKNIPNSKLQFSNAVIFNEYHNEEQTVVCLKTAEEDKMVALTWNKKDVKITEIICGDLENRDLKVEDYKELIIQLILLFDADARMFSGVNIVDYLRSGEIPDDVAELFEGLFKEGKVYYVPYPTLQDFYLKKDITLIFEDILNPVIEEVEVEEVEEVIVEGSLFDVTETNQDEKCNSEIADETNDIVETEKPVNSDDVIETIYDVPFALDLPSEPETETLVVAAEKEVKKRANNPVNTVVSTNPVVEQLSFDMLEEAYVKNKLEETLQSYLEDAINNNLRDWEQKLKNVEANPLSSNFPWLIKMIKLAAKNQVFEDAPKYDLSTVKKERPLIFDDEKVKKILFGYGLDYDTIQFVMNNRKKNRDRLIAEKDFDGMMLIHEKAVFRGNKLSMALSLGSMVTGDNVLLSGVASAGKSTMVETISALSNLPLLRISGSADTSQDSILGTKIIRNGEIEVIDAPLVTAIKKGYLFFFDELSSVDAQVATMLNPVLDEQKVLQDLNNQLIEVHPEARFIAAINDVSLGYAGTQELNSATKSRFIVAKVEYVDEVTLSDIIKNSKPARSEFQEKIIGLNNHSNSDVKLVLQVAEKLKDAYEANDLSEEVLAIRGFKSFLNLSKVLPVEQAIMGLVNKMDEDELPIVLSALQGIPVLKINASSILGR